LKKARFIVFVIEKFKEDDKEPAIGLDVAKIIYNSTNCPQKITNE